MSNKLWSLGRDKQFNSTLYWVRNYLTRQDSNQSMLVNVASVALEYGLVPMGSKLHAMEMGAHYNDVMMGAIASQITSLTIVRSTVYSGADKKTSKLRVTGLCEGNSPGTGEFPTQMSSNAENVSIWWRHHEGSIWNTHLSPKVD